MVRVDFEEVPPMKHYPQRVKETLMNLIDEMSQYSWLFSKTPERDFTRKRQLDLRPSQILCKPPLWCRIGAPQRRFYIMARKNRSPEENERRAKIRELLLSSNVSSMDDIQNLFKETIA